VRLFLLEKKMAEKSDEKKAVTNEEGDALGTGNDARLKLLEQINNQNDADLAKNGDLADVNDDGTTSVFSADDNLSDDEIAARELKRAEEEANARAAEAAAAEHADTTKHKIKVNGKELEFTTEELIARAQKVESADEYLKEAAQKLREAEAAKPAPTLPSKEDVAAKAEEERRALVRAIQMGTEEEAMAAIEKLQSRGPSVSADDVARTVDERVAFNDAVSRFQTDFKDLADDPVLLNIVLQRDKDLLAQGDKRTYWERYEAIGSEVRAWRESIAKPAESAKKPDDKQSRKASAPAVPQGAGTKAPAAVNEEDREESTGEIISAMAKARGGPQWLRS
jgi:hypothetical protein